MMSYSSYDNPPQERDFGVGSRIISPFIKAVIIANIAIFLIQYFLPIVTQMFGLTPALFLSQFPTYIYQPVTYMFLHGGLGHIFFNMLSLWMFGTEIEYNLGTKRFTWFYLFGGLSGAALTLIVNHDQMIPVVGASAAIYSVLIAYWVTFPERYLYLYFLLPIKVKWAIPGLILIGFLSGPGVAHMAHLGGAVFGLAYMKLDWRFLYFTRKLKNLRYERQERKLQKNKERAEDTMKRVDAILDRINEVGIDKLTREERKFLEDASSELAKRKNERAQG